MSATISPVLGAGPHPGIGIGFGEVRRAFQRIVHADFNDAYAIENSRWSADDLEWQTVTGNAVGTIVVEQLEPQNILSGPQPSMLDRAPEDLPVLTVMAFENRSGSDDLDQVDKVQLTVYIEGFVKAGPFPQTDPLTSGLHAEVVQRRAERMVEALNRIVMRQRNLLGVTEDLRTPPQAGIGQSHLVTRDEGVKFLRQGFRMQYTVQRIVSSNPAFT